MEDNKKKSPFAKEYEIAWDKYSQKDLNGCLTLIKNKKPPKALMGLFFLSNLPNISCGMLRDVLLYK